MTSQTPRGTPRSGPIVQEPAEPTNQSASLPVPAERDPSAPALLEIAPMAPVDGEGIIQELKGHAHAVDSWSATVWSDRSENREDY